MPSEGVVFLSAITVIGGFVLLFPVVRALAARIRAQAEAPPGQLQAWREDILQELMVPDALAVFIPIVAIGGFFTLMIVRTISKAYTAKLQVGNQAGAAGEAKQEELAAALEELRREVAELAERVDFTERLLAKQHEGQKLAPPR